MNCLFACANCFIEVIYIVLELLSFVKIKKVEKKNNKVELSFSIEKYLNDCTKILIYAYNHFIYFFYFFIYKINEKCVTCMQIFFKEKN